MSTIDPSLTPAERQALRDICDLADLIEHGRKRFLLVPVTSTIMDVLAAFESELADMEDDDPDHEHDGREPRDYLEPNYRVSLPTEDVLIMQRRE